MTMPSKQITWLLLQTERIIVLLRVSLSGWWWSWSFVSYRTKRGDFKVNSRMVSASRQAPS